MKGEPGHQEPRAYFVTEDIRIDLAAMTDEDLITYGEVLRRDRQRKFRDEKLPLLVAIGISITIVIGLILIS
jgi:hypothetical protein